MQSYVQPMTTTSTRPKHQLRTTPSWTSSPPTSPVTRQSGLVKLTDDGNKATYGKPTGDEVYVSNGDAFVKVARTPRRTHQEVSADDLNQRMRRPRPTLPFDDFCMPDDVLASHSAAVDLSKYIIANAPYCVGHNEGPHCCCVLVEPGSACRR